MGNMERQKDDKRTVVMGQSRRPALTTVGIRKPVSHRLSEYIEKQYPHPVIADVVSIAVTRWLDQEEGVEIERVRNMEER